MILTGGNVDLDSLPRGESKVEHWRKLSKLAKNSPDGFFNEKMTQPVDWIAVKNKYFVQSLIPSMGAEDFSMYAHWSDDDQRLDQVAGALVFKEEVIEPGRSLSRDRKSVV